MNLGNYDEAIRSFDEAIRLDPGRASTWYNKAVALQQQGKLADAEAALVKARSLGWTG
jgi:Flp pilus assembly protein TadD